MSEAKEEKIRSLRQQLADRGEELNHINLFAAALQITLTPLNCSAEDPAEDTE